MVAFSWSLEVSRLEQGPLQGPTTITVPWNQATKHGAAVAPPAHASHVGSRVSQVLVTYRQPLSKTPGSDFTWERCESGRRICSRIKTLSRLR